MRARQKPGAVSAHATIPPESEPIIESLQEEKEHVFRQLQEHREDLFFNGESVFDVTARDIVDDSVSISDYDVKDIDGTNDATWEMIYRACLYNTSGKGVLDPVNAVDTYNDSNTVDASVLRFDTENVTIVENKDTANVFIDPPGIRITASLTEAELYPEHEVVVDVNSLTQFLNEFDQVTVTTRTDEALNVIETLADDRVQRKIGTVDFGLSYSHTRYEPIPPSQDETEDSVQETVDMLTGFTELTDDALTAILTTLTSGAFMSEFTVKFVDLLLGEADAVLIDWGVLAKPQIVNAILRLTDYTLTPIPQEKQALITRHEAELSPVEEFPERQELTTQEKETITSVLPNYVAAPEWTTAQATEALYNVGQSESLSNNDLLAYLIQPYDNVAPTGSNVKTAIEHGHRLRTLIEETDDQYGTELLSKVLRFTEKKVPTP